MHPSKLYISDESTDRNMEEFLTARCKAECGECLRGNHKTDLSPLDTDGSRNCSCCGRWYDLGHVFPLASIPRLLLMTMEDAIWHEFQVGHVGDLEGLVQEYHEILSAVYGRKN
jgi:hypothetical protein